MPGVMTVVSVFPLIRRPGPACRIAPLEPVPHSQINAPTGTCYRAKSEGLS